MKADERHGAFADPHIVRPAVLDQALGSVLGAEERVACGVFVWSCKGRILKCEADHKTFPQLVAVTDQRLIKVAAWYRFDTSTDVLGLETSTSMAMGAWQEGERLTKGRLARRYLWLGQIREVEVVRDRAGWEKGLVLHTATGGRETLKAYEGALRPIEAALREGLSGPGRDARPPSAALGERERISPERV